MGPQLPDLVEISEPGALVRDPDTGNMRPAPATKRQCRANLSRMPSRRQNQEINSKQATALTDWVVLLDPAETVSSSATIKALTGRRAGKVFEVDDEEVERRSGLSGWRATYVAVPLKLVSDLQPSAP